MRSLHISLPSSVLLATNFRSSGSMVFSHVSLGSLVGSVVGDEVGSVVVAVDDEQPGCREPEADGAAVDAVVQDVNEYAGDVGAVVGVVSDELC